MAGVMGVVPGLGRQIYRRPLSALRSMPMPRCSLRSGFAIVAAVCLDSRLDAPADARAEGKRGFPSNRTSFGQYLDSRRRLDWLRRGGHAVPGRRAGDDRR